MTGFSNEVIKDLENIVSLCDHILESEYTDQDILKMQKYMETLEQESEDYRDQLTDQQMHSKSRVSRRIAAQMLTEEEDLEDLFSKEISKYYCTNSAKGSHTDLNIGALYVEYLAGRAMQSVRDALIGAMNLKIISEEI